MEVPIKALARQMFSLALHHDLRLKNSVPKLMNNYFCTPGKSISLGAFTLCIRKKRILENCTF